MYRALDASSPPDGHAGLIFLDLAAAFPSLARRLATTALRKPGAPQHVCNTVGALFSEKSLVLRLGGTTEPRRASPQGSP